MLCVCVMCINIIIIENKHWLCIVQGNVVLSLAKNSACTLLLLCTKFNVLKFNYYASSTCLYKVIGTHFFCFCGAKFFVTTHSLFSSYIKRSVHLKFICYGELLCSVHIYLLVLLNSLIMIILLLCSQKLCLPRMLQYDSY